MRNFTDTSSYLLRSFFFHLPATSDNYTLSLHDALPIWRKRRRRRQLQHPTTPCPLRSHRLMSTPPSRPPFRLCTAERDRKSTRLNSSHRCISYAVFCLKKKNNPEKSTRCHHCQCGSSVA